jgi:hypothetical protein
MEVVVSHVLAKLMPKLDFKTQAMLYQRIEVFKKDRKKYSHKK